MPQSPGRLLTGRLSSQIGLVARQWRRAVDQHLQPFDLTQAVWMPLVQLARASGPMRQNELATALSLDNSAVVRLLNNLQQAGLVVRHDDPDDRRAKAVAITDAGRERVARVESVSAQLERELLDGIAPQEVEITRRVLTHLGDSLLELNAQVKTRP